MSDAAIAGYWSPGNKQYLKNIHGEEKMNEQANIPYICYESTVDRFERTNKKLWILCIILIAALILSNIAWIVYEMQFEYVEETTEEYYEYEVEQSVDSGGNNIVGRDIAYGKAEG